MAHNNVALRELDQRVDELNEKMQKMIEATLALTEIVRVENEESAWRDDRLSKIIQRGQAAQKEQADRLESVIVARNKLTEVLIKELGELGPMFAHISEEITAAVQSLREPPSKKKQVRARA